MGPLKNCFAFTESRGNVQSEHLGETVRICRPEGLANPRVRIIPTSAAERVIRPALFCITSETVG